MRIRSPLLAWVVAGTVVGLFKLLLASCRKVYVGVDDRLKLNFNPGPEDLERFVMCVWHDELLIPTFAASKGQRHITCCLVSQHQDGSYLANAMAFLGYSTVRGSSRRGGAQAVRKLLDDTAGKNIVITPDGPCGPRRVMKAGAVYLSSQLGRRLLLSAHSATRAWRLKGSWTDMLIPVPFSTVYIVMDAPIAIPAELSREQLDHYVDVAQKRMDELIEWSERMARGEAPARLPEPDQSLRSAA